MLDTREFVQTHQRVPARVFLGADSVAPADFLIGLAGIYQKHSTNGALPHEAVGFSANTVVLPARHIAKDSPNLFGGWVIHKEGFRAPKILEVARLQAWTLKPALRKD